MKNKSTPAQKEISACFAINGASVKMNFAAESNAQAMKNAKAILSDSFTHSPAKNSTPNLDNRILTQS